jgi:hypothetical protein
MEFQPNAIGHELDYVLFQRQPEDEETGIVENVIFNTGHWIDMGSPDKVTVTIEPGDLLNV